MRKFIEKQYQWIMLELHQIWATLIFLVTVNFDFDGSWHAWLNTAICFASLIYFVIAFFLGVRAKKEMRIAKERIL